MRCSIHRGSAISAAGGTADTLRSRRSAHGHGSANLSRRTKVIGASLTRRKTGPKGIVSAQSKDWCPGQVLWAALDAAVPYKHRISRSLSRQSPILWPTTKFCRCDGMVYGAVLKTAESNLMLVRVQSTAPILYISRTKDGERFGRSPIKSPAQSRSHS